MKKIEAIIRPHKLAEVRAALTDVGVIGMTLTEVIGSGREKGYSEIFRSIETKVDTLPKVKVEIILDDNMVDECIQVIIEASRSGQIGDGKILVTTVERFIRIRTGDEDTDAT